MDEKAVIPQDLVEPLTVPFHVKEIYGKRRGNRQAQAAAREQRVSAIDGDPLFHDVFDQG
jgi:hypothetical protein